MRIRDAVAGWIRPVEPRSVLVADCWLAGGLATILLPLTAMMLSMTRQAPCWRAAILVAAVLLHGSLALRRWCPPVGFAMSGAAMLVLVCAPHSVTIGQDGQRMLTPVLFHPSTLAYLPVLYSAALQARRTLSLAVLGCSLGGVAVATIRFGRIIPAGYPLWQYRIYVTLAFLLVVAGTWGLGASRKMMVQREATAQAELTRSAILAERSRIARDVHDIVAHSLAVIVRQAEGGAMIAPKSPERAVTALRTIADVGRGALDDMRGLLGVLRDHRPDPRGLRTGVPASLADVEATLARVRGAGLGVDWVERGQRFGLGAVGELVAHHVIVEALTNTLKHAGVAAHAAISVDWGEDALVIDVSDDGGTRTGPRHPSVPGTGTGLRGLEERVSAVDGVLTSGRRGHGFGVRAVLPRRGAARPGDAEGGTR